MAKFDTIIDALEEEELKEFHNKLASGGFYEQLFNADTLIENDISNIRKAVRAAVANHDYNKFKDLAPGALRQAIDALEDVKPLPLEIEETNNTETDKEFIQLSQKLLRILDQRDGRGAVPKKLRPEFSEILAKMYDNHGMSYEQIEEKFGITAKTISQYVNEYKEKRGLTELPARPSTKEGPSYAHTGAEQGLKETIEKESKARTVKTIEDHMNLGRELYDKFFIPAMAAGIDVKELAFKAIDSYLKQGDVYQHMVGMEDENIELARQNRILQAEVMRLNTLNKNLRRTMIAINS